MTDIIQYEQKEFCGHLIRQRSADGYLNATEMCQANKKLYADYIRLDGTQEYLNELSSEMGYPISQLIEVRKGNSKKFQQGTWIHPHVATHLAQWLSPKFAVFVSKWLWRFMQGDLTLINEIKQNNEALQTKYNELKKQQDEKDIQFAILQEELIKKEKEAKWLHETSKRNVSFQSFVEYIETLYMGGCGADLLNFLIKIGTSIEVEKRCGKHRGATSPDNSFTMIQIYKSWFGHGLEGSTEKYLHKLFAPFNIKSEDGKKASVEFFMIHPIVAHNVIKKVLQNQQEVVEILHNYIQLLEDNQRNFDVVNDILLQNPQIIGLDDQIPEQQPIQQEPLDQNNEPEVIEPEIIELNLFERINEVLLQFENVHLLTHPEDIKTQKSEVQIQCPHQIKTTQAITILRNIICNDCVRDKEKAELTQRYFGQMIDFANYQCLGLIDETTKEFEQLNKHEQAKIHIQNEIITRLAIENVKMLTAYTGNHNKFRIICQYGHETFDSRDTLKLRDYVCTTCHKLQTKINNVKIFKHANEEQLKLVARENNWTYIGTTTDNGIYEWQCQNGHTIFKSKRDAKHGYCAKCNKK